MSKKHKHRNNNQNTQSASVQDESLEAMIAQAAAEEQIDKPHNVRDDVSIIMPTAEKPSEEKPVEQEPVKIEEAVSAPAPEASKKSEPVSIIMPTADKKPSEPESVKSEVKPEAQPTTEDRKVPTARELLPLSALARRMMNAPTKSPAVAKLIRLFDEYKQMMQTKTTDKYELKKRVEKLYQIMSIACPNSSITEAHASELVRTVYDKLAEGWGTVYNEGNIFQLDYTLPGGPSAIDQLNMFWSAMIQLVEGATTGSRIAFSVDRLGVVVKNRYIVSAISKMKTAIEQHNFAAKHG